MYWRSNRAACILLVLAGLSAPAFGCSSATTEDGFHQESSMTRAAAAGPTAAQLLEKVQNCNQVSNGTYKTDTETAPAIPVCDKNGAVFWTADMDIDCDGQTTDRCNANTDPWYQSDTSFSQSDGRPLIADQLPYVVIPSPSAIWNYQNFEIRGGAVVAVIYNNQVLYAVFGDTGPQDIIGEASYAAAEGLGINPNPASGGTDSGVTYIVFKNSSVSPIESHERATELGQQLAQQFIDNN
ncbi:glycoside hydrolase family 75 protein [Pendulispora brunnea]|uniref:Glycoside hydrolase family 75 protein n=1 Tax=Pendulispora brunnea TaxID=2905690 RepID=A0ABZ2K083_9BACT